METKRKWYPKKSAWARAKAAELREQWGQRRAERVPSSNWRGVRAKMSGMDSLLSEARKYDRLAERLEAAGE